MLRMDPGCKHVGNDSFSPEYMYTQPPPDDAADKYFRFLPYREKKAAFVELNKHKTCLEYINSHEKFKFLRRLGKY